MSKDHEHSHYRDYLKLDENGLSCSKYQDAAASFGETQLITGSSMDSCLARSIHPAHCQWSSPPANQPANTNSSTTDSRIKIDPLIAGTWGL